ncbi:unnamed protein product [Triticum turgidum subsp. durum]|uniref:F-box/LRR-repeat protein 15-like leucin rich repeat domain-containing protein n=1 Tax=Triticum turgidum subsp. durum TaxID=4567 RepID=A0A9R1B453_TRITD|nr:unnamed protein product [Triticum turgidum subsp. durum]
MGINYLRIEDIYIPHNQKDAVVFTSTQIAIQNVRIAKLLPNLEIAQVVQLRHSMEDIPEPLLAEIVKRITKTSDLNSLSLVSKQLCTVEAEHRDAIRVGCGLNPSAEALVSLFSRFPNLVKVEINYSGWKTSNRDQLNNQGLLVLSSHCPSLSDLALSLCSYIDDAGLGYLAECKNLKSLRLDRAPAVTSTGIFQVAVGCSQKLGFVFLLAKCKALETLYLDYVIGLKENEMIALFQRCSKLKTISLKLMPLRCEDYEFRTPLTDVSLKALAISCPMLQVVELTFAFCDPVWPTEIGFTQEGIVTLIQSCPIRALLLNGANILYDKGMKCLSSSQFLENLELVDCRSITDASMNFIIQAPCLSNLTLRKCKKVTDDGMAELARSQKLESLTIIGCCRISQKGVQGAAKSVHYLAEIESPGSLKGMVSFTADNPLVEKICETIRQIHADANISNTRESVSPAPITCNQYEKEV